jgi:HEAT repeat protein
VHSLQATALYDPDPFRRARCLAVLDHVANEASTQVFAAALRDPVVDVRRHALHGLTCERCRSSDIDLDDVVEAVLVAFAAEEDPEIRHRIVVVLGGFSSRSDVARRVLDTIAADDPDELLRTAASAVLATGHTRDRKALERLARGSRRGDRRRTVAPAG